jgi:hypothetical protein
MLENLAPLISDPSCIRDEPRTSGHDVADMRHVLGLVFGRLTRVRQVEIVPEG